MLEKDRGAAQASQNMSEIHRGKQHFKDFKEALYLQVGPFCIYSLDTNRLVEVCNPSKTTTGHRIQSPPIPHSEGVIFLQHFQPH